MESVASPHPVLCAACAEAVVKAMQGEHLAGGETGRHPLADAKIGRVEIADDDVPEV